MTTVRQTYHGLDPGGDALSCEERRRMYVVDALTRYDVCVISMSRDKHSDV